MWRLAKVNGQARVPRTTSTSALVALSAPASESVVTRRGRLLRATIGAVAVGALGALMRSMVRAVTREDAGSGTRGTTTHLAGGDAMTEQPGNDVRSGDEEDASAADGGKDTGRPGPVRTQGETTVDEAIGQGPLPQK
jgi:hypothetical protein